MIQMKLQEDVNTRIDFYNKKLGSAQSNLNGLSTYLSLDLKNEIERGLRAKFDQKAAFFIVEIVPSGFGAAIVVKLKDKKAAYFYHGTKRHEITSSRPMPINPESGIFAYRVNHPGTKSHRGEVNAIISFAKAEVRRRAAVYVRQGVFL